MSLVRKLSTVALSTGVVAGGLVGVTTAASAAPTAGSTVTFEIESGTLDVTAPTSGTLGSEDPGNTVSGSLGSVTVTDGRAGLDASWSTGVTSTAFTTGGGTEAETIEASSAAYWSGPATATTGTGTFTPGQASSDENEPLDGTTPITAFAHTGGTGNNSATWSPTVLVDLPSDGVAGTYTGTITHSVA